MWHMPQLMTNAQFTKYTLPAPDYVPCFIPPNNTQRSYCPPDMKCIPPKHAAGYWTASIAAEDLLFSTIPAPGCCPMEAPNPCYGKRGSISVPGCCPNGTVCCMDDSNRDRFIGCADNPAQCCGGIICPIGFSCCKSFRTGGSYCCPGEEFCGGSLNIEDPITGVNRSFTPNTYGNLTGSILNVIREYTACQNLTNSTLSPWSNDEAYPCGDNLSWCRNSTAPDGPDQCVDSGGNPIDLNNSTLIEQDGRFCCPINTTACVRTPLLESNDIIGCVDESRGETCCAQQICPYGSRCCRIPSPPHWQTNVDAGFSNLPANATFSSDLCCPNGTFCCAQLVQSPGAASGVLKVISFCGRNENCTSYSTITEMSQPIPSLTGFYPDFIDSMGWINKTKFISEKTLPPGASACGTCGRACKCTGDEADVTCGDQCQLISPSFSRVDVCDSDDIDMLNSKTQSGCVSGNDRFPPC